MQLYVFSFPSSLSNRTNANLGRTQAGERIAGLLTVGNMAPDLTHAQAPNTAARKPTPNLSKDETITETRCQWCHRSGASSSVLSSHRQLILSSPYSAAEQA